ncbi:MAG: amidohydrolase family protein [Phycisphaerales bacterium]
MARRGAWAGALMFACLIGTGSALAQGGFGRRQPEIVLRDARIVTMAGEPIEGGTIVLQGNVIRQIGKEVPAGDNARVIDAKGWTITPGLIDVDGALGMTVSSARGNVSPADAMNRAIDSFDRYDTRGFKEAVRNGVTAVYISPRSGGGITGMGSVVRLEPGNGPWAGKAALEEAALCIDMGSGDRPIQRLATFDRVRKQLRGALDYREALETYKEELADYEKKVKERAEKEGGGTKPTKPEEKKDDQPAPGPKPEETPKTTVAEGEGAWDGSGADPAQPDPRPRRGPRGGPRGEGPPAPGAGSPPSAPSGGGNSNDELKKPAEPSRDARSEVILKALDREVPVRVRAQRSEDILNAIDLAREFNLRLIIDGGAESYLVGRELKRAEAPVVLGPAIGRDVFVNDELARRRADAPAMLSESRVDWVVGSGAIGARDSGAASRFILLNAQATVQGAGREAKDPLRLVTADAADFLGVSETCGRLRVGMPADVVVWTGDPLDPGSRVAMVYVGGELVYQAEEAAAREGAGAGEGGDR